MLVRLASLFTFCRTVYTNLVLQFFPYKYSYSSASVPSGNGFIQVNIFHPYCSAEKTRGTGLLIIFCIYKETVSVLGYRFSVLSSKVT